MKSYVVFRNQHGKELCAYTLNGSFVGEAEATRDLLAYENGIDPESISITVESRKG